MGYSKYHPLPIKIVTWNHNMKSHHLQSSKWENILFIWHIICSKPELPTRKRWKSPTLQSTALMVASLYFSPSIFVATVTFPYFPPFLVLSHFTADCRNHHHHHHLSDRPKQLNTILFSGFKSQTCKQSKTLGLLPNSKQNMPIVQNTPCFSRKNTLFNF